MTFKTYDYDLWLDLARRDDFSLWTENERDGFFIQAMNEDGEDILFTYALHNPDELFPDGVDLVW